MSAAFNLMLTGTLLHVFYLISSPYVRIFLMALKFQAFLSARTLLHVACNTVSIQNLADPHVCMCHCRVAALSQKQSGSTPTSLQSSTPCYKGCWAPEPLNSSHLRCRWLFSETVMLGLPDPYMATVSTRGSGSQCTQPPLVARHTTTCRATASLASGNNSM